MGCTDSKLDSLPAVALCRDRCKLLDLALHHGHGLAHAHTAYIRSLATFGDALRRCIDLHLDGSDHSMNHEVHDQKKPPNSVTSPHRSSSSLSSFRSTSNSHIKFNSDDSDAEESSKTTNSDSLNHITTYNYDYYNPEESLNTFFDKFSISYMKKEPTQSIVTYSRPADDNHYEVTELSFAAPAQQSDSSWNIMNFFDPYELPFGNSSRRDMKGLKLKDETFIPHDEQRIESGSDLEKMMEKKKKKEMAMDDANSKRSASEILKEVNVLFQKASESGNEVMKLLDENVARVRPRSRRYTNAIVSRATGSPWQPCGSANYKAEGSETRPFIENENNHPYKKTNRADGDSMDAVVVNSGNLVSTLKKLCMWEKKLHREVKSEEKLRMFYKKKCRELKQLIEKGAEANKIDSARTLIGTLSTRLKIYLHVIEKISMKISRLSDEELRPLMDELILCLFGMWKAMLECHRRQLRVVAGAKTLDKVMAEHKIGNDAGLEVFIQLRLELGNWNLNFSNWVYTQKCYARALNGWLVRCLTHEPEDALKGLKPSVIKGAPPVFTICHEWARALEESIKENAVTEAMEGFHDTLKQMTDDRINLYLQSKQHGDTAMEKKVRTFVKEEQKVLRAMQDRDKRLHRLGTGKYKNSIPASKISLQAGLKHVFEAAERFAFDSVEAYEDHCTGLSSTRMFEKNRII